MAKAQLATVEEYPLPRAANCPYLTCDRTCDKCTAEQRRVCFDTACEELQASIQDRRENGGTMKTVRAKAFELIELLVDELDD